jgi:hypothetical protein
MTEAERAELLSRGAGIQGIVMQNESSAAD